MRHAAKAALVAVVLLAGITGPAAAGAFEDGAAAFNSGDYQTALHFWQPLAKKGVAGAQYGLGVMYANGEGVEPDYQIALGWFRKAADQGNAGAQVALAVMYANGKGVARDYAAALGWFRKAADLGNTAAEFGLGVMYENGQGVVQDYQAAARWYRVAADTGNASAQYALGILYYKGQGVPRDPISAHMWFDLALAGRDTLQAPIAATDVERYRDLVAAKMSKADIAEALKRAREWRPGLAPRSSSGGDAK